MSAFSWIRWAFLTVLWTLALSDDALKNHRLEKRNDDSFLFFGGWRPVRQIKSSPTYLQTSATNRYHDILSALPYASASFYRHQALPSRTRYQKDIYNYYPRPAIKSAPKKNTPVYMERYTPTNQQKSQKYRGGANQAHQFVDLQSIDLKQIQDLHDLILQAKHLPLSNLNLPGDHGKPLEIIEVSLQSLQQQQQQGNLKYGGGSGNGRYNRNRNSQRGKGYKRPQQSRAPAQKPVQFEYVAFPKPSPILPQVHPKDIDIGSIQLPHGVSGIQDIVDLKNVQIVEVPFPAIAPLEPQRNNKGRGGSSSYSPYASGTRSTSKQQYKQPEAPKAPVSFSYYSQQFEKQPRKQQQQQYSVQQYSVQQPQSGANQIHLPENLEAELIKLDDDTLKSLLSNLQVLEKNPHELLKYLPINHLKNIKDENVQLVLQLPEGNHESNGPAYAIHQNSQQEGGSYGNEVQYGTKQQSTASYDTKGTGGLKVSSNGYQEEVHTSYQTVEHSAGGYESENYAPKDTSEQYASNYSPRDNSGQYETNYSPKDNSGQYDSNYQEEQSEYEKKSNNYQGNDEQEYQNDQQQYSQQSEEPQKESYSQGEQPYIQVVSPHSDREPVLALELHHGQTVEEALKSLDPEILQKIGAVGKNGIEIEVVEVPVDDYVAESKKTETVVPAAAANSTVTAAKTKRTLKIMKS